MQPQAPDTPLKSIGVSWSPASLPPASTTPPLLDELDPELLPLLDPDAPAVCSRTRSFCYVDDLVKGVMRLSAAKYNKPVNVGNPVELKIIEFLEKIVNLTGSRSKIVFMPLPEDDPKQRKPNIGLAKKLMGWQPKVSLDQGMRLTIEFFKKKLGVK